MYMQIKLKVTIDVRPFAFADTLEIIDEAALIVCCRPCPIVRVRSRNQVAPAVAAS
jgi:hypothetical protein